MTLQFEVHVLGKKLEPKLLQKLLIFQRNIFQVTCLPTL
jgi:hypothetical protein